MTSSIDATLIGGVSKSARHGRLGRPELDTHLGPVDSIWIDAIFRRTTF